MKVLVVTNPFGGHDIGHEITDSAEIDRILASDHAHHVVAVDKPDDSRPKKVTQPEETKEA